MTSDSAQAGTPTDRAGLGTGKKIALGVGVFLLLLAAKVLIMNMMSKHPPEIISFNADQKTVEAGKPLRLSWDLKHVTSFSIGPNVADFTAKAADIVVSETTVTPRQDTTYTLVASGPDGIKEASVSVSVVSTAPAARNTTPALVAPPVSAPVSDGAPAGSSSTTAATGQLSAEPPVPLGSYPAKFAFLIGEWECLAPKNHFRMRVDWDSPNKEFKGYLTKQGEVSENVGYQLGELVWIAEPSGEHIFIERQKWRSGANGKPSGYEWRNGNFDVGRSSLDSLVTSNEFTRVR
jgi:hypothetical protein